MDDHTVTGRVLAVLDAVAQLADRATLTALTHCTGIPKPTVRRIAADLVTRGILERDADGYRLGPRLVQLGAEAARQQGVRRAAAPYVHDLFARTGEIAWMSAFTESCNTLVECAFGSHRADDMRKPWPAAIRSARFMASASGRLVLAHRPELVENLRSRPLPRLTRYTTTRWGQVAQAIEAARDDGLAIENEETLLGYNCVAAGVYDRDGNLVGALGVVGRTSTFVAKRLSRPVRAAATQLSLVMTSPA
jgi:DNA-binding IclR family transcriptional regulator